MQPWQCEGSLGMRFIGPGEGTPSSMAFSTDAVSTLSHVYSVH